MKQPVEKHLCANCNVYTSVMAGSQQSRNFSAKGQGYHNIKQYFQLIIPFIGLTMDTENFIYSSYCELTIISNDVSPDEITEELKIVPERSFRKGEQSISRHSGSIVTKPHNLWALNQGHPIHKKKQ